ncbi:cytidine deaminase-like protein [Lipomyces arxii]|uniref:cytidine deaminase-like protein n=1 Tax=Lipomyces arxii TaxID=56418 RepID=UPI0034CD7E19
MLIGICGPSYSGKNEVARFLELQGFVRLYLIPPLAANSTQIKEVSDDNEPQPASVCEAVEKFVDMNSGPNSALQTEVNDYHMTATKQIKKKRSRPTSFSTDSPRPPPPRSDRTDSANPNLKEVSFHTVESMIDYVTKRWTQLFVTTSVYSEAALDAFSARPFFLLLAVQAPLLVRYQRAAVSNSDKAMPMKEFLRQTDEDLFMGPNALTPLMYRAHIQLINATQSIELLYLKLANLNLTDETRLRPSWDAYFMELANLAARRSNCMKRRVGCVLVKKGRVIATGYNGTPRGVTNCNDGGCERCNSGGSDGHSLGTCLCLHAEENALMEAGRERIANESVLYCNTCPCLTCSIKIVQMGLKEVIYSRSYSMDSKSSLVLKEGGVMLRQYSPPEQGVVVL